MPITINGTTDSRVGYVAPTLGEFAADCDGTHVAPPNRTGFVAPAVGSFTTDLQGQFGATASFDGDIDITIGGFVSSIINTSDLVHGDSYTITGSYGTRSVDIDIFDDASNASVSTLWNDAHNISYTAPIRGVSLPHSNISEYAAGRSGAGTFGNVWLSQSQAVTSGSKVFCMAYRRHDPNWAFGPECNSGGADNNFKLLTVSSNGSWFETPYWYHDHTTQKCGLTQSWQDSFYSSGGLGNLNSSYINSIGGSSDQDADPWYNWVKVEYRFGLGSSGQSIKMIRNNRTDVSLSGQNTYNSGYSGFAVSLGTFARVEDTTAWLYFADIAMVVGPDAYKRVILTDNATYASSTILEFQPITTWNGNVDITINKGQLSSGTAHLHIFDDSDAGSYVGEITLA